MIRAVVGDRLVAAGRRPGDHERICSVLAIRDCSGEPPYLVQWYDTGDEEFLSPGPDASILNLGPTKTLIT